MSRKHVEIFSDNTERSLISDQSGAIIFIDLSNNHVTLNLPPPEAGLYYEFVITNGTRNFILNSVNNSYAASDIIHLGQKTDNVGGTITATAPTIGDRLLINCDGTKWYGSILCKTMNDFSLD